MSDGVNFSIKYYGPAEDTMPDFSTKPAEIDEAPPFVKPEPSAQAPHGWYWLKGFYQWQYYVEDGRGGILRLREWKWKPGEWRAVPSGDPYMCGLMMRHVQ